MGRERKVAHGKAGNVQQHFDSLSICLLLLSMGGSVCVHV